LEGFGNLGEVFVQDHDPALGAVLFVFPAFRETGLKDKRNKMNFAERRSAKKSHSLTASKFPFAIIGGIP
jgi:hypothetical protein